MNLHIHIQIDERVLHLRGICATIPEAAPIEGDALVVEASALTHRFEAVVFLHDGLHGECG
jgi:hypothetical protein